MTRERQKAEERAAVDDYLRLRGISGTVAASEAPDFLVTTAVGVLGIEVTEYHGFVGNLGGSKAREAEETWEALSEFATNFRARCPEMSRFSVALDFRSRRLPPKSQFEPFCAAVVAFLHRHGSRATRSNLTIRVDEAAGDLLVRYVSRVTIREVQVGSGWRWPGHSGGGVGTSDDELMLALGKKLKGYRPPAGLVESHLVVYGGGPGLSRIGAPLFTQQLEGFSKLNEALAAGAFDAVALLNLRDFLWLRGKGWSKLSSPA